MKSICLNCGAPLNTAICDYCGSEKTEYIDNNPSHKAKYDLLIRADEEYNNRNYRAALIDYEQLLNRYPNDQYILEKWCRSKIYNSDVDLVNDNERINKNFPVILTNLVINKKNIESNQIITDIEWILNNIKSKNIPTGQAYAKCFSLYINKYPVESKSFFDKVFNNCDLNESSVWIAPLIFFLLNGGSDTLNDTALYVLRKAFSVDLSPGFYKIIEKYRLNAASVISIINKCDMIGGIYIHLFIRGLFKFSGFSCEDLRGLKNFIKLIPPGLKNNEVIMSINNYVNSELKSNNDLWPKHAYTYNYKTFSEQELNNRCDKFDKYISKRAQNGNSGFCFIATATLGSYDHPVVMDLRMFRDNWLLKREWGVKFTNWYYKHGPKAARAIEKSSFLRKLTFFLIVKPLQFFTKFLM